MKNKRAFTLMEVLSVIALMGIIVVLVVPQINGSLNSKKDKEYEKVSKVIETAASIYHLSNKEKFILNINDMMKENYVEANLKNPLTGEIVYETPDDWKIKFLTSGDLTYNVDIKVDAFLVGGGGAGSTYNYYYASGGGGGGGNTLTEKGVTLSKDTTYKIIVGDGGTPGVAAKATEAFGFKADPGKNASSCTGGAGGIRGGGAGVRATTKSSMHAIANTGSGGRGANSVTAGNGGSGIAIIRNAR